jgi:hypothetical protein
MGNRNGTWCQQRNQKRISRPFHTFRGERRGGAARPARARKLLDRSNTSFILNALSLSACKRRATFRLLPSCHFQVDTPLCHFQVDTVVPLSGCYRCATFRLLPLCHSPFGLQIKNYLKDLDTVHWSTGSKPQHTMRAMDQRTQATAHDASYGPGNPSHSTRCEPKRNLLVWCGVGVGRTYFGFGSKMPPFIVPLTGPTHTCSPDPAGRPTCEYTGGNMHMHAGIVVDQHQANHPPPFH